MAQARRELLLRAHGHRLGREDLEDCYAQATLELIVHARDHGALSSRAHTANVLEQRFLSRVFDRRRALTGRSPMQAALHTAISLNGGVEGEIEIVDERADVERIAMLRFELELLERVAPALSSDQRLVLACQVGLQKELPYGPGGHPDPRGAYEEDCSSTVNYVLYRSGVRPIAEILKDNPLAQDYVDWGVPGPGRWVTIYATTEPSDHVFVTIAGLRLDTSHNGTDVGPSRDENGPRWRILDHIPTWARWSVRHPPGL